MRGYNRAIICGTLGNDPDIKYIQDGTAVATISVATNESWTDKDGNKQERTEWHRIVLWKRLAEIAGEYLTKGSKVLVEGQLQTRKWQDKDGSDRYSTEIRADQLQMLGGGANDQQGNKSGGERQQNNRTKGKPQGQREANPMGSSEYPDDGIPFN